MRRDMSTVSRFLAARHNFLCVYITLGSCYVFFPGRLVKLAKLNEQLVWKWALASLAVARNGAAVVTCSRWAQTQSNARVWANHTRVLFKGFRWIHTASYMLCFSFHVAWLVYLMLLKQTHARAHGRTHARAHRVMCFMCCSFPDLWSESALMCAVKQRVNHMCFIFSFKLNPCLDDYIDQLSLSRYYHLTEYRGFP